MTRIHAMTPWSPRTAVTPDTVKITKKTLTFSRKSLKWYKKLCNMVDPFLRNCVTKSKFRYLKKIGKGQKKALPLKMVNSKFPQKVIF